MKFAQGSKRWLEEPPARGGGLHAQRDWRADPSTFESVLGLVYPQVRTGAPHAVAGEVLLAVVDAERGEQVATALLAPGETAIVGRHPACHVRLPGTDLSLRHLAVLVADAGPRRPPCLRLWDLRTGVPFVAEDGVRSEAMATEGPLFATLGCYVVAALPLRLPGLDAWPADARDAWRALPRREFLTRVAEGTGAHASLPGVGAPATARVTRLHTTCDPSELSDQAAAVAEVTVDCDARRERYYLTPPQLERGVLIGRYTRCLSDVIDDPAVSRVHLLIASAGRQVYAIDTASSSGSATARGRFDSVALGERARISIGDDTMVTWRRYPRRWA